MLIIISYHIKLSTNELKPFHFSHRLFVLVFTPNYPHPSACTFFVFLNLESSQSCFSYDSQSATIQQTFFSEEEKQQKTHHLSYLLILIYHRYFQYSVLLKHSAKFRECTVAFLIPVKQYTKS